MRWRPMRWTRWIAALFAIGSVCFAIGPAPGYVDLVGEGADGVTFFVGSIFFTSAAMLQLLTTPRRPAGNWWAALIQAAGTIFFNISTFAAMNEALDTMAKNRLVWTPDVYGSICFLVSSALAYWGVRHVRGTREFRIGILNLAGSVAFGISAVASFIVPSTGTELDLAAANWTTAIGAVCFLVGALILWSSDPDEAAAPAVPDAQRRVDPAGL
jgi:hypothetical protein